MSTDWITELNLSVRRLRRRPARGVAGVLTLALGIGSSTAAFSAVRAVVLEPLPVEDEDALLVFWLSSEARNFDHIPFLPSGFDAVREAAGPFDGVAAVETVGARPGLGESTTGTFAVDYVRVAGDFFGVLGVRPGLGRLLDDADDEVGAEPTVVIGHDYWLRERGGDPSVVGTTLRFNELGYTVVGVAPPGFDFPQGTDAWVTIRGSFPDWSGDDPIGVELDLVGRVSEGATHETALGAANRLIGADSRLQFETGDVGIAGVGFRDLVVGPMEPVLTTTLAAALALLVVAIANATLLFLAGGARVVREAAMRRALGATRVRVAAPVLADATLQALLGVGLGVVLAQIVVSGIVPMAPDDFARFDQIELEATAVVFAAGLGFVSMIASAGFAGTWLSGSSSRALRLAGRSTGHGGESLRRAIAGAQIGLAVLAGVGAGLLWQTVRNLEALDRGFESDGLHVVTMRLPFSFTDAPESYWPALERVVEQLEGRADVAGASMTFNAPLSVRGGIDFVPRLEGQSEDDVSSNPFIGFDAVSPSYFGVTETEVTRGRGFGPEDGPTDPPAVIVNEAAAALLWPGATAVGKRIFFGGLSRNEWREVVGVVEDHRFRSFPEVRPAAYVPLSQYDRLAPSRLLVRAPSSAPIRELVSERLEAEYPGVKVLTIESMVDVMRRPLLRPRFAAAVLMSFAGVTLLLAGLGVHGVFSVLVQERRAELGVRIALGADVWNVAGFVARRVLTVGVTGAIAGLVVSLWASELIDSLFFGISAGDPRTMAAVGVLTVVVGMAAGAIPALKATRTDPLESLRAD